MASASTQEEIDETTAKFFRSRVSCSSSSGDVAAATERFSVLGLVLRLLPDRRLLPTTSRQAQLCAACHGQNGVPTDPNTVPIIWGQERSYLFKQMRDASAVSRLATDTKSRHAASSRMSE
jgi:cytochrome c553